MCGITGFSKAPDRSSISNADRLMRHAVLAIENRGTDATGYAWMNPDGKGFYCKKQAPAHEAVSTLPQINPLAVTAIGHTRWATQGSKYKNENNHPVVDDGVMLVHNGVILNDKEIYGWLDPDYPPKAEVDTAAFAAMLAHPEELYAGHFTDLLSMVTGANAFAWIMTSEPEALHLARTQDRPLTIGWTRCGDLVMSSTPSTLHDLSQMMGVKIRRYRELGDGMYLKVVRGEIVEEKSFRTCKRSRYFGGSNAGTTTPSTPVGTAQPDGKVTYYVSNPGGVHVPVDQPVGGVVGDKARQKARDDEAFWARVDADDEYWERVWNGEDVNEVISDLIDKYEDQDDEDLSEAMIRDAAIRFQRHMELNRPQLTVIAGEKGKTPALPPYDYELEGETTVDEEQKAYEQYLADMDEVDWSQMVPRRGWAERKESAADDVTAALSREDR